MRTSSSPASSVLSFNPLSRMAAFATRVGAGCNPPARPHPVSIPFRGWRPLQQMSWSPRRGCSGGRCFNPLSRMAAFATASLCTCCRSVLQRVSIPFRGWRPLQHTVCPAGEAPLLGPVSIPFRGWRPLQLDCSGVKPGDILQVSIPFRGWRPLQRFEFAKGYRVVRARFNPLSRMAAFATWRGGGRPVPPPPGMVSIPFRGWRPLQPVSR